MKAPLLVIALVLSSASGCGATAVFQQASREAAEIFKPRDSDYGLKDDEEKHQWDVVGETARGVRGTQRDPADRWFKQNVMSEKANEIERSLGVE
jgi:hypothetical protein